MLNIIGEIYNKLQVFLSNCYKKEKYYGAMIINDEALRHNRPGK
jgi:hypothetical protein